MGASPRNLIIGGAIALGVGCGNPQEKKHAPTHDHPQPIATISAIPHDGLQKLKKQDVLFVDADGKKVDLSALQRAVRGRFSTLSFMFAGCGTTCPTVKIGLGAFSEDHPYVTNFIIAANPEGDYNQHLESEILHEQGLTKENTKVLFPVRKLGTHAFNHTFMTAEEVAQLEKSVSLDAPTNGKESYLLHNSLINVYSQDGKYMDFVSPESDGVSARDGKAIGEQLEKILYTITERKR